MARKSSSSSLDQHLNEIVARAARDISSMIRSEIASQRGAGASAPTRSQPPAAAETGGKRRGKQVRSGGRRGAGSNDAALESLLAIIRSNPGLRSEEIQKRSDSAPKLVKAGLAKLRAAGRVKTSGVKRAMIYNA